MEKNITLFGEEIKVAYNMAVQICYEAATDRPFDLMDLTKAECRLAMYFAIIVTNNPDTKITMDMLIREATFEDIKLIDQAANDAISAWYNIPKPAHIEEQHAEEGEDPSKNA